MVTTEVWVIVYILGFFTTLAILYPRVFAWLRYKAGFSEPLALFPFFTTLMICVGAAAVWPLTLTYWIGKRIERWDQGDHRR